MSGFEQTVSAYELLLLCVGLTLFNIGLVLRRPSAREMYEWVRAAVRELSKELRQSPKDPPD